MLGGFEHVGGDFLPARDDRVRGLADDDACEPHRAAGMGAAADRDDIGVALDQVDAIERHAEPFRDALREAGAMALAARQRADRHVDAAFRRDRHLAPLARRPGGELDVIGERDAAALAAARGRRAPLREAVPVRARERRVHDPRVVPAVVGDAQRVGVGQRVGADQVAPPQRDAVEAAARGRALDQPLDHEHRLGPAGAAIGIGGRRVAGHRAGADMRRRDAIDAREHRHRLGQRHERDGVRPDIAEERAAQREENGRRGRAPARR